MSSGDEDLARLRRAFAQGPASAPLPESCPLPETLWSALHGELSPAEIRQVVRHIATCPACAEEWRMARTFAEEPLEDESEPVPLAEVPRRASRRRLPWAPLITAAGLVLAIGLTQRSHIQKDQIAQKGTASAPARSAEGLNVDSRVAEGSLLSRQHCLLKWTSIPNVTSYEITVQAGEDLPVVAQDSELKRPEFVVPPAALAGLPPRSRLYWQVQSVFADGSLLASKRFIATIE